MSAGREVGDGAGSSAVASERTTLLAEIEEAEAALTEATLALETRLAELARIDDAHRAVLATRYATLERLRAAIADARARMAPNDPALRGAQEAARARAQRAAREADAAAAAHARHAARAGRDDAPFRPSDSLKQLFRRAARRVHPDYGIDDADRARRTRQMAEVNALYRAGDESSLRRFLDAVDRDPLATEALGVPDNRPDELRARLERLRERLRAVRDELVALDESPLGKLAAHINTARQAGRDLLAELAADVDREIAALQREFATLGGSPSP